MPGLTFDRQSVERIGNVVRKVERMPGGEQDLVRRRAGGLGRAGLWEVTAVQTGPETVTIKRVDNIDFDLNDPSEKEDILYDPDKTPSVGDTGLLIRLGGGALLFFSRDIVARAVELFTVSAVAGVSPDNPDTHYAAAIASKDSIGSDEFYAVMKLTPFAPLVGDVRNFSIFTGIFTELTIQTSIPSVGFASVAKVSLDMGGLKEDFDIDTVTWNDLVGKGTTPGGFAGRGTRANRSTGNTELGGGIDDLDLPSGVDAGGIGIAGTDVFTRDVYGILLSWSISSLFGASRAFLSMEIGTEGYMIRWE